MAIISPHFANSSLKLSNSIKNFRIVSNCKNNYLIMPRRAETGSTFLSIALVYYFPSFRGTRNPRYPSAMAPLLLNI